MATIVTRAGKGSPLTHNEVDANFENLNTDKVETSSVSAFGATLIDDADAATARTTLGLGTAATTASTDYATSAQGALADSAVQPNDSPSFGSITVTGTVDGRDVAADGTKLDGIEAGATADQTKADIDALGIAASTAATLATARNIALTGDVTGSANFDGSANISITATVADDSHNHSNYVAKNTGYEWTATGSNALSFRSLDILETASGDQAALEVYQDTAGADAFMQFHISGDYAAYFGLKGDINDFAVGGWSMGGTYYRVWHAGNDGSGSGLDADLLDGNQASAFAPVNGSYGNDFYANQSFADNWFRPTGDTGLYFQSYGTGIRSVNSEGGQYGSVATYGGINGWEGYSIGGRVVFMHDMGSNWGIYNDVNNEWMVYGQLNGGVELRYDNATRLYSTSAGATVAGELSITGAQYIPRAWVNFNGTGTVSIRAGGNVSSITDLGTGTYNVNMSSALADANYGLGGWSAGASSIGQTGSVGGAAYSTTAFNTRTAHYSQGYQDAPIIGIVVMR